MSRNLKVGVVGMGAIGPVHMDAYKASGQAEIAAICDLVPAKLNTQGERFGVAARFTDYRKMLKTDIDCVSVCVPNAVHREIAVAALKAGKHVLLEKPMSISAAEAGKILSAAKASKTVCQMAMVNRQRPDIQVLKDYIDAGLLGDIYHMRAVWLRRRGIPGLGGWFTTKARSGGGPIIDIGVHMIDAAMYVANQWKPTHVSAQNYAKFGSPMKNYKYVSMWAGPPNFKGTFDVEDFAAGMVRYAGGATLSFHVSWAANAREEMYVDILGTRGGARVMTDSPLTIYNETSGYISDLQPKYDERTNPFHVQAQKFLAACRGECKPAASFEQGMVLMKVLDGIYSSSKLGREVTVKA